MADFVYNIALGRAVEKVVDAPNSLLVLLLKAAEADDALRDHDELNALLGAAGNTEADFTNYARKTGLSETVTLDDTNNRVDIDVPDQTWTSAGNGTNNTLTDLIVAVEESAAETGRIPLTNHDFSVTTDGSDITAQFDANGFYRAS